MLPAANPSDRSRHQLPSHFSTVYTTWTSSTWFTQQILALSCFPYAAASFTPLHYTQIKFNFPIHLTPFHIVIPQLAKEGKHKLQAEKGRTEGTYLPSIYMTVQKTRTPLDAEALARYVRASLGAAHGPVAEISQFQHGQSNPTYLVTMATSGAKWVLRKKPHGHILPSAHAVEREYRVLKALEYTEVPAPKPVLLCEDSSVLGTPFYLMEFVEGRVFQNPALPGVKPLHRYAMYASAVEALTKLHKLDYRKLGLEGFGKPDQYCRRVVSRWSKQVEGGKQEFARAGVKENPQMAALETWLNGKLEMQCRVLLSARETN